MSVAFRPPTPESLTIEGPVGAVEAKLEDPGTAPIVRYGIVCHPHPLHGGTMDNKVVHTVARAMQELGAPTLRFNFRGTGASAGAFDDGRGEVDDLLAVASFARLRWPQAELWLAGFSFGAWIALQAENQLSPAKLVAVAPPVRWPRRARLGCWCRATPMRSWQQRTSWVGPRVWCHGRSSRFCRVPAISSTADCTN